MKWSARGNESFPRFRVVWNDPRCGGWKTWKLDGNWLKWRENSLGMNEVNQLEYLCIFVVVVAVVVVVVVGIGKWKRRIQTGKVQDSQTDAINLPRFRFGWRRLYNAPITRANFTSITSKLFVDLKHNQMNLKWIERWRRNGWSGGERRRQKRNKNPNKTRIWNGGEEKFPAF